MVTFGAHQGELGFGNARGEIGHPHASAEQIAA